LFACVFIKGIEFAKFGLTQTSATLGIPMVIPYASISIAALLSTIYSIYNLINHLKNFKVKGKQSKQVGGDNL
jgi:TRAP-type C4-dicarboxylate transport system permease small subunit